VQQARRDPRRAPKRELGREALFPPRENGWPSGPGTSVQAWRCRRVGSPAGPKERSARRAGGSRHETLESPPIALGFTNTAPVTTGMWTLLSGQVTTDANAHSAQLIVGANCNVVLPRGADGELRRRAPLHWHARCHRRLLLGPPRGQGRARPLATGTEADELGFNVYPAAGPTARPGKPATPAGAGRSGRLVVLVPRPSRTQAPGASLLAAGRGRRRDTHLARSGARLRRVTQSVEGLREGRRRAPRLAAAATPVARTEPGRFVSNRILLPHPRPA
jgi:hypothetical protein